MRRADGGTLDDGMVEVELVGEQADGPDPSERAQSPPSPGRTGPEPREDHALRDPHPRRHLLRTAPAMGLGLVVLLGLGLTVVEQRRDEALVASVAHVPGLSTSLREPLVERWQTGGPTSVAGGLVLGRQMVDGQSRTVAHDARTGEVRWAAPSGIDAAGSPLRCRTAVAGDALLVCMISGGGVRAPNSDAVLGGLPGRLLLLDAEDGSVRDERPLNSRTVGWDVLEEDLVLARRESGALHISRSRLVSREVVWSVEVPLARDVRARQVVLGVAHGLVVVEGRMAVVVDGRDGEVLGTWDPEGRRVQPVQVQTGPLGFAVWRTPREAQWFDRDGHAGATLPGSPLEAVVDDGSSPHVTLVQDRADLLAVDVRTGEVLWRGPPVRRALTRIDGLVVVEGGGSLHAIDLATGEGRWSAALGPDSVPGFSPVTDGVRLLVPGYEVATGRQVTAVDLRDGTPRWTLPLPGRGSALSVDDGVVRVRFGTQVAIFG
ncbi:PQQ-binding-like beta-propeller repeat protein [Actinotalea sp. K2]|uniref:outer membrane protein assembly factor BamB family protein n=1 Tax=Actinotalea sp. K2 TaxID=2939438 RepID=UPI002017ED7B|nr:PQQ-binding-like beta-propeller repeat protein [Actinotalea sp. K2]MCL3860995.1 PQQ-like beta-propeller repeat protein [Actinotalea sp. K2]